MGNAEFDIQPIILSVKMDLKHAPPPDGIVLKKQASTSVNCLAEESTIYLLNGKVVQDIVLRLRTLNIVKLSYICGVLSFQAPKAHRLYLSADCLIFLQIVLMD
ncbi:hypothetical protein IEQ34_002219 [Dendrobium chrysotoxum]|uniref:Uncharacterized protein n=1 Tax=Dendrobium chrysotoxum TaxID=161865 RepID=A0AAV7HJB1_DENCH|nr:hypothetical protein IEQ34_002219 [Dendrobium chrysotoxum]